MRRNLLTGRLLILWFKIKERQEKIYKRQIETELKNEKSVFFQDKILLDKHNLKHSKKFNTSKSDMMGDRLIKNRVFLLFVQYMLS